MARGKRKTLSKLAAQALTQRAYGDEPMFEKGHRITEDEKANFLTYYSKIGTDEDAHKFYKDFFKANNRSEDANKLATVPNCWINRTGAWLARLSYLGVILPDPSIAFLEAKIQETLSKAIAPTEEVTPVDVPNIQQRIREKNSEFIGEIEGMLDDNDVPDIYQHLKTTNATGLVAKAIINKFQPRLDELTTVVEGTCPQLKEGYKHLSKKQIKETLVTVERIIGDAMRYADVNKKARKPRKKKIIPANKQVGKLKFAATCDEYKIASISPTKIVGAQELWVFNPKYKKLGVFRAMDSKGLAVQRSNILNVDEKNSYCKRIGRKTEERLQTVISGGKVALRKLMDEINGDRSENGRITKDTILLRVQ